MKIRKHHGEHSNDLTPSSPRETITRIPGSDLLSTHSTQADAIREHPCGGLMPHERAGQGIAQFLFLFAYRPGRSAIASKHSTLHASPRLAAIPEPMMTVPHASQRRPADLAS